MNKKNVKYMGALGAKYEGDDPQIIQEQTEAFFRHAFVVDGDVKFITNKKILSKLKMVGALELNDSERGTFYIAHMELRHE